MKKTLLAFLIAGLVVANANAVPYTVENPKDVYFGPSFLGGVQSYSGFFDLSDEGYDSTTQQVYWAKAEFTFVDVFPGPERMEISLGGSYLDSSSGFPFFPFFLPVKLGGEVVGSALMQLSDTGILEYEIRKLSGSLTDFALIHSKLIADAGTRVPDGGATLMLLGLSFLGILGARRKLASVALGGRDCLVVESPLLKVGSLLFTFALAFRPDFASDRLLSGLYPLIAETADQLVYGLR